ncbi:MAG: hypothetical protein ACRCYU_17850, partial [Nocardioides sp.]
MTCSKRCRQARHRFTTTIGTPPLPAPGVGVGQPRRLAYADPPYPGLAGYYRDHPDYAGEVDHQALIRRLSTYDGWALSTSARALPAVLAICHQQNVVVRVAAWHRGHRPHASARGPLNAWEPLLFTPTPPRPDGPVVSGSPHYTTRPTGRASRHDPS